MANDLAGLRTRLAEQLSDPAFGYWNSTEMGNLVTDAVNSLYPRFGRPMTMATLAAIDNEDIYTVPSGMTEVWRVEWLTDAGEMVDELEPGTWEVVNGQFHVNPNYSTAGWSFRLTGLGRYDVATNLIPDDLVPLVLARARAEAYRRALGDRANFKQWAARNQVQNVSVNELLGMTQEAEALADKLTVTAPRTWRKPVPGRV